MGVSTEMAIMERSCRDLSIDVSLDVWLHWATVYSHLRARFLDLRRKIKIRHKNDVCVVDFNLARRPRPTRPQT